MADKTPCAVLNKDKKGKTHRGFYWLYQDCIDKLGDSFLSYIVHGDQSE